MDIETVGSSCLSDVIIVSIHIHYTSNHTQLHTVFCLLSTYFCGFLRVIQTSCLTELYKIRNPRKFVPSNPHNSFFFSNFSTLPFIISFSKLQTMPCLLFFHFPNVRPWLAFHSFTCQTLDHALPFILSLSKL